MSKGLILELKDDYAIVLTPDGQFKNVKRPRNVTLAVGQELELPRLEQTSVENAAVLEVTPKRKRASVYLKSFALAASFMLILAAAFSFIPFGIDDHAIAYVHVDINPSIEIGVNAAMQVISVTGLNEDGTTVIRDYTWKGKALEDVTADIVHLAEVNGYLELNRDIIVVTSFTDEEAEEKYSTTIATSLQKASDQLYATQHQIQEQDTESSTDNPSSDGQSGTDPAELGQEESQQIVIHQATVKGSLRTEAQEQGVSLGRYQVYLKSQELGLELNLEDVKKRSMTSLILMLAQAEERFNPVHDTHPGKGKDDSFIPPGQQKKQNDQPTQQADKDSSSQEQSQEPVTEPVQQAKEDQSVTASGELGGKLEVELPLPALQRAPAHVIERIFQKNTEDEKKNDGPPGQQFVPPGLQKKGETEHPSQKGKNNN